MKGSIDILLLSLLKNRDMYGYEMAKSLKQSSDDLYNMSEGTLYSALKRLEKKDWVTNYWSDNDIGGRRKYYSLTDEGKKELEMKLNQWNQVNSLIDKVRGPSYEQN